MGMLLFSVLITILDEHPTKKNYTEKHVLEGGKVTLSCNHVRANIRSWQWYKQYPNTAPEFILEAFENLGPENKDPKDSKEKKQVNLTISSAEVTDSAVYYCALRPTVIESPETLYKNPDFSLMILYSAVKTFCVCVLLQ
uniref:Si:ch211-106g8.20 n=1 Tax=Cyprinus carpio TaxID=7962 RepID=A0A8C1JWC3_CYPCA